MLFQPPAKPSPGATFPTWLLATQVVFAIMLFMGGLMEIASRVFSHDMPSELQSVLGQLHHDPWVAHWVLVSNILNLFIAAGFLSGAARLRKGRASGIWWTRRSAWSLIVLVCLGQLILTLRLYPDLAAGRIELATPSSEVMLVTMIAAAVGACLYPALALFKLKEINS